MPIWFEDDSFRSKIWFFIEILSKNRLFYTKGCLSYRLFAGDLVIVLAADHTRMEDVAGPRVAELRGEPDRTVVAGVALRARKRVGVWDCV